MEIISQAILNNTSESNSTSNAADLTEVPNNDQRIKRKKERRR